MHCMVPRMFALIGNSKTLIIPSITSFSKLLSYGNMARNHFQQVKDKFLKMNPEEKRGHYKCGSNYITLDEIPPWSTMSPRPNPGKFKFEPKLNDRVSLFSGDITMLEIDAIVNAANESLSGGGGVDGFIHNAAGYDDLQAECRTLNGCLTGQCKITGGYRLPAKYIIHCVGPIGEKPNLLASCYRNGLDLLVENNLKTIAFPCISTGVFGYPNEAAAHVAIGTVRRWLETDDHANLVDRIIFCLFLPKDIDIYYELMYQYFPLSN